MRKEKKERKKMNHRYIDSLTLYVLSQTNKERKEVKRTTIEQAAGATEVSP